jgi:hypothetical protein
LDSIGNLLSSVLRWLEQPDDDEKWWQLETQVTQLCLLELELKVNSNRNCGFALENVRDMVEAMLNRDREAARRSGAQALDQLKHPLSDDPHDGWLPASERCMGTSNRKAPDPEVDNSPLYGTKNREIEKDEEPLQFPGDLQPDIDREDTDRPDRKPDLKVADKSRSRERG